MQDGKPTSLELCQASDSEYPWTASDTEWWLLLILSTKNCLLFVIFPLLSRRCHVYFVV